MRAVLASIVRLAQTGKKVLSEIFRTEVYIFFFFVLREESPGRCLQYYITDLLAGLITVFARWYQ